MVYEAAAGATNTDELPFGEDRVLQGFEQRRNIEVLCNFFLQKMGFVDLLCFGPDLHAVKFFCWCKFCQFFLFLFGEHAKTLVDESVEMGVPVDDGAGFEGIE